MEIWSAIEALFASVFPTILTLTLVILALFGTRYLLNRYYEGSLGRQFRIQLILLLLSFLGLVLVILVFPISESMKGQLLGLIGILLSAAVALSSTTFLGNIMAGLMQRAVRSFRLGDFIRAGEHFGRVSDMGLFHVEIQTEDRDLTTMPNLYLATNPVKVIRSSGTLVTSEVSIGYDVPDEEVTEALLQACGDCELEGPFVRIIRLGDFSVVYRAAGLLTDVKRLLSTQSQLKKAMLNRLHGAGIEIVSPNFMNQRVLDPGKEFIPEQARASEDRRSDEAPPEEIIFDKAEEAESLERLRQIHEELQEQLTDLKSQRDEAGDEAGQKQLDAGIEKTEARLKGLAQTIEESQQKKNQDE